MKKEIIKQFKEEFEEWLVGNTIQWFYSSEIANFSIKELMRIDRVVDDRGKPFILDNTDIIYIVNDENYAIRLAEAKLHLS